MIGHMINLSSTESLLLLTLGFMLTFYIGYLRGYSSRLHKERNKSYGTISIIGKQRKSAVKPAETRRFS